MAVLRRFGLLGGWVDGDKDGTAESAKRGRDWRVLGFFGSPLVKVPGSVSPLFFSREKGILVGFVEMPPRRRLPARANNGEVNCV